MQDSFEIEGRIAVLREGAAVRFAHLKTMDKPENHALHLNNHLELYVFVSGKHQYIVDNQLYDLQRGDIVVIGPRQVHKALPAEEGMYERFFLLLDTDCLRQLAADPLPALLSGRQALISPEPSAREQGLQLLYALSDCLRAAPQRPLAALGLLLQFLELLANQTSSSQDGNAAPLPPLLERVLRFVQENAASIGSVAQVAEAMGISPQYLSTYFRQQIGTPLKIYIQAKKIAIAKELLERGADVTQACFDSGFNDCSYFIRIFRKYTGTTPHRYAADAGSAKLKKP